MEKKIQVHTSKGWKSYKLVLSGSRYLCYDLHSSSWAPKKIGEASSIEDGVVLIKVDAQKYGGVGDIKM